MSPRAERRTTALTRDQIVQAAIEILDSDGERALTFRALAARLATGSGAIYWHISGKDQLLGAACESIVTRALGRDAEGDEPAARLRQIALSLFDAIDQHPWVGSHLGHQPDELGIPRIFEGIGTELVAMGVANADLFDATSALVNYILGVAQNNAANARRVSPGTDRDAYLTEVSDGWAALDPATYPFVHRWASQLPQHDDRQQFLAGVDLILRGIRTLPDDGGTPA